MCKYSKETGKTTTSTINLVHSKRKGIFIHIREMPNNNLISLRNQRSFLTFRLYWTDCWQSAQTYLDSPEQRGLVTGSRDVNVVRRVNPAKGVPTQHTFQFSRTGATVSSCNQRDRYYQQDEAAGEYTFGSYKQCLVHPDRRQQDNWEVMQTKQKPLILNRYTYLELSPYLHYILSTYCCRIESYSCKMTANDKQLYKRYNAEQGGTPHDLQALSPPQTSLGTSPAQGCLRYFGEISAVSLYTNRNLWHLVSLMLVASCIMPDYT